MNAKDVEKIGYAMSISDTIDGLRKELLQLDPRIAEIYADYKDIRNRDDEIFVLFNVTMSERYGEDWAIRKNFDKAKRKEIYEECRKQVWGDEYDEIYPNGCED